MSNYVKALGIGLLSYLFIGLFKRLLNQRGASSMVVLILVVLLIIVGWEVMTFSKQFIDTGGGRSAPAVPPLTGSNCIGSNTKYDCYDQDEGTDLLDN